MQVKRHVAEVAIEVDYTNIQDPNSVNISNCMDSVPEVFRHFSIWHECLERTNFPNNVAVPVDVNRYESLVPASDKRGHGNASIAARIGTTVTIQREGSVQQEGRDFADCSVRGGDGRLPAPGVLFASISAWVLGRTGFFILGFEPKGSAEESLLDDRLLPGSLKTAR